MTDKPKTQRPRLISKHIKYFIIVFLFSTSFLTAGCKSSPTGSTSAITKNLKKIVTGDMSEEFEYSGNLLKKRVMIIRGEKVMENIFSYDEKGRLGRVDHYSTAAGIPFTYYETKEYSDDNILLKSSSYIKRDSAFVFGGNTVFQYESGKMTRYNRYYANNELASYHLLKYQGDNITEDAQYDSQGNLQFLESYEYDDKPNPLLIDKSNISAFSYSKNNITKWIETYYTVTPPNKYTSTIKYTYDGSGYPERCEELHSNILNGSESQSTSISYYEYY